jgi:hypothetical protein
LDHCVEEGGRARYLSVSSLVVTTAVNVFALKLQNFLTLIMFSVRRFGKGTKKLALTNHGQFIEDYVFDYFLKQTEPDCSLYAKDGTEKKIHKVSDFFMYA